MQAITTLLWCQLLPKIMNNATFHNIILILHFFISIKFAPNSKLNMSIPVEAHGSKKKAEEALLKNQIYLHTSTF